MSAYVANDGAVTSLDGKAAPDEIVSEEDAGDVKKLSKLLTRLLRELALLRRRWVPRRIVFRDVTTNGGAMTPQTHQFEHRFGGRVLWWVCDWNQSSPPSLQRHTTTTDDTLVLRSYGAGIVSICVEEAG